MKLMKMAQKALPLFEEYRRIYALYAYFYAMLRIFRNSDPFKVYYLVSAYIIIFSMWWGYLLYAKNETAYHETVELNEVQFKQLHPAASYYDTAEYKTLNKKYERQKLMILLEGSVFFVLLIVGSLVVRRVFKKEIELAAQQRNFLHSITHELKSPLSTIKLSLQTMVKRKLEAGQAEKLINNSLVDLDRLENLVDNILFAAKIERDEPGFANDEINVSELVEHIAGRFYNNKKNITITNQLQPEVYLHVDILGFTSVITNLIENAIKYSEDGGHVAVKLHTEGNFVYLSVADDGIGIAESEKKKIFDKFYRVGNEDTRRTKGTGLGLYIVKRFVEIYKGQISVMDNTPKGSIFRLTFTRPDS